LFEMKKKKTVRNWGGKGKRKRNQRVLSEWMGGNVWDLRSVQIPRFRIESLSRLTGVTKDDGRVVKPDDGRHEGVTGESSTLKTAVNRK